MGCGSILTWDSAIVDGAVGSTADHHRADLPLSTILREKAQRGDRAAQRSRFNTGMPESYKASGRDSAADERPDDMQILKQLFKQLDPVIMSRTGQVQGEVQMAMRYRAHPTDGVGGQLLIHLIKARDLVAMDLRSNSSDPYVTIELLPRTHDSKTVQSRVVHEQLSPVFNEYLSMPVPADQLQCTYLWVRMWDHDKLSEDDAMGQVLIPLAGRQAELVAETPQPRWYGLQLEVDNPVTGSVQLTLDWQPPLRLDCLVHGVDDLLLCRGVQEDGSYCPMHFVLLCYLSQEEQANVSEVMTGDKGVEFDTIFPMEVRSDDVHTRALHLRIMAVEQNSEQSGGQEADGGVLPASPGGNIDAEVVAYSGTLAGECYIALEDIADLHGKRVTIPLSDQRDDDDIRTRVKVSARAQELQQSLQAHALYGYPQLLFRGSSASDSNKIVQLRCTSTKKAAHMYLRNGVPVMSR